LKLILQVSAYTKRMEVEFRNKVLIIGYGSVSRCTLPLLLKHITIPLENITIIDIEDKSAELSDWTARGIRFFQKRVTPENLDSVLSGYLSAGSLLIDLSWNIDCCAILKWCHDNKVLYLNTSVEIWDPESEEFTVHPYERTLYYRQMQLNDLTKNWEGTTTCIVDHGANPGLISHFARQGLIDIAHRMIADGIAPDPARLADLIRTRDFAHLAMEIGVRVVHCSERDTQVSKIPKKKDEFVGTWSIMGLREEGIAPAEMGWGTHETHLPEGTVVPPDGPKNEIILNRMSIDTEVRSWIPDEEIVGMVIRHGEGFGISDRWTVWEDGRAVYRPTVHYAYMPCEATRESLQELRERNFVLQEKLRIMTDSEIVSGADKLGALLMGHPYKSWWTGSILTIEEARRLAPGQNATTVQVALGVIAAVIWMIKNPDKGFRLPDDLPHDFILGIAKPYLGTFHSGPSDWTPCRCAEGGCAGDHCSPDDPEGVWVFKNFLTVQ